MFPASAGMIPTTEWLSHLWKNVPRKRGDDPTINSFRCVRKSMFPASAGMIPMSTDFSDLALHVPRKRGDDPSAPRSAHA